MSYYKSRKTEGKNEIQNDPIYLKDCAVCCVNTGKIRSENSSLQVKRCSLAILADMVNGCVALRWLPCRVKTVIWHS